MLVKTLMIASAVVLASVIAFLLVSCGYVLRSDNENAQRASEREKRKTLAAMRAATALSPRGRELAGAELERVLAGRTLVARYGWFPDGKAGEYVEYQYFLPDGRFIVVDNWRVESSTEPREGDFWKVTGPRLCFLNATRYGDVRCFRVAEARAGELQLHVDAPGTPFDGLLSIEAGILEGPPPETR